MKQLLKSVIQNQIIISANIEDDISANIEDENKKNKDSKKFTLYNNVIDNLISIFLIQQMKLRKIKTEKNYLIQ